MKLDKLVLIGDCIERLSNLTNTHIDIILDRLTGYALSDKEIVEIYAYFADDINLE